MTDDVEQVNRDDEPTWSYTDSDGSNIATLLSQETIRQMD